MRYAINPTKIHKELGWLPETKFADGIKKTIQWYLDNRECGKQSFQENTRTITKKCMEIAKRDFQYLKSQGILIKIP